jgi:hypothetical protein
MDQAFQVVAESAGAAENLGSLAGGHGLILQGAHDIVG